MTECIDKASCIEDLKANYTKVGHPIAFGGIQLIYNYYRPHLKVSDIENVLSEIESYTLHREFHSPQRNPSYSHFKRYQFQADLVDVRSLSEFNDGVNYILTCIDTFTRYGFARLLRGKQGKGVVEAFQDILNEAQTTPLNLVMDRGSEFYNQHFESMCRNNNIKMYSPDSFIHGAYIERFNRSLQQIMYKFMTEAETRRYIDYTDKNGDKVALMPLFLHTYNNRVHRMIGISPEKAENDPSTHEKIRIRMSAYHAKIKPVKPKFKVGDLVRISKMSGKFGRGYEERAVQEVFRIHSIERKFPKPLYVLSNYRGDETIKGKFYQNELVRFNGSFRIEKVLRKRVRNGIRQIYVKWKGYDDSYNEWIDEANVTQTF